MAVKRMHAEGEDTAVGTDLLSGEHVSAGFFVVRARSRMETYTENTPAISVTTLCAIGFIEEAPTFSLEGNMERDGYLHIDAIPLMPVLDFSTLPTYVSFYQEN
jgi:hypothetical protein